MMGEKQDAEEGPNHKKEIQILEAEGVAYGKVQSLSGCSRFLISNCFSFAATRKVPNQMANCISTDCFLTQLQGLGHFSACGGAIAGDCSHSYIFCTYGLDLWPVLIQEMEEGQREPSSCYELF